MDEKEVSQRHSCDQGWVVQGEFAGRVMLCAHLCHFRSTKQAEKVRNKQCVAVAMVQKAKHMDPAASQEYGREREMKTNCRIPGWKGHQESSGSAFLVKSTEGTQERKEKSNSDNCSSFLSELPQG